MNKKRYSNITKSNNTNKISESNTKSGILQNLIYGASVGTGASLASNAVNSMINDKNETTIKCQNELLDFIKCMDNSGENFIFCKDNYLNLKKCLNIQ